MGEKIDYIKESRKGRSLLTYLIIECATKQKDLFNMPNFDAKNLDIQFIINGIDMPVKEGFKLIENQMNEMIKSKAKEMVKEKLNEFSHSLDAIVEHIESVVYTKFDNGE